MLKCKNRTDATKTAGAQDGASAIPDDYVLKRGETVAQVVGRTINISMDDF